MTGLPLPSSSRARFADFEADFKTGEFSRAGQLLRLQDLPLRLLQALVERPGELVTRTELRERLWGAETFVDYEAGLNTAVAKLREALEDSADSPRFIETIPKRGYRFIGRAEWASPAVDVASASAVTPAQTIRPAAIAPRAPLWRRPAFFFAGVLVVFVVGGVGATIWRARSLPLQTRVAVVLFDNETGHPEFDQLAQQLTDATVFALTAHANLAVIGNAAVLRTPRPFRDIAVIRDALHADFLVIGQIQTKDDAAIVRAHLIRAADQAHVWVDAATLAPGGESALEADMAARIERAVATHVPHR